MSDRPGQEGVFFDALLTPHRSLGPRGFLILMSVLAALSFASGVVFVSIGAWPVFGFFGLDVLLVYIAFRANYRQARAFESLTLTDDVLTVRYVSDRGKEQSFRLEPYWLRIEIDEPVEHDSTLILRAREATLAVGRFLTPEERLDLARALRSALVRRHAALIGQPSAS